MIGTPTDNKGAERPRVPSFARMLARARHPSSTYNVGGGASPVIPKGANDGQEDPDPGRPEEAG